ncbi:dna helicase recq family member [Holotrichia oblita]|uniref:Dna helicase recq family member n=1 Tax=Holotrichia oblita TaxID=644536 RepID=A0ACB9T948_HOLOL|nr:dna helicase recq family member [Holotrichia oblita]
MLVKSKKLVSALQICYKAGNLNRIAIDEVHCCSEWGHDFRPDYRYLGLLKNLFEGVPLIGLTATATTFVLNDIREMLEIAAATVIKAPFDRPNLCYKVISKPSKFDECIELLNKIITDFQSSSGIIYAISIKECEDIAKALRKIGVSVCVYHAQLISDVKVKLYNKWMKNSYQIVVATIAFGLGIDKPDVRLSFHFEENNNIQCKTMCDNCLRSAEPEYFSLKRACTEIYKTIDDAKKKEVDLTLIKLLDSWFKLYKVQILKTDAEDIVAHLLSSNALKEEKCYTSYNVICYIKNTYETIPEHGLDVYMRRNAALRRYLGPPSLENVRNPKRKLEDRDAPSTSNIEKIIVIDN